MVWRQPTAGDTDRAVTRQGSGAQRSATDGGAHESPRSGPRLDFVESDQIEFKAQWGDAALQALASFANTRGGTVYVGVADDGGLVGTDVSDAQQQRIAGTV